MFAGQKNGNGGSGTGIGGGGSAIVACINCLIGDELGNLLQESVDEEDEVLALRRKRRKLVVAEFTIAKLIKERFSFSSS